MKITKDKISEFLLLNAGILLLAVGIYFFKFPNDFSTGGVSGITVILTAFPIPLSGSTIMLIINMFFLIMGFIFLGKEMGAKSIYGTLALSFMLQAFEFIAPLDSPLTDQKMLELAFSIILPGMGSAILFTLGASSGGTDILALIIGKNTGFELGSSLLLSDFLITLSTLFFFGIETCLYSVLGLILKSFVVDNVIENISTKKVVIVITQKETEVKEYVTKELKRGITVWGCVGGFTGEKKATMLTVLTRVQAKSLRTYVRSIDNKAFIIMNNSTEVIGKGFYRANL